MVFHCAHLFVDDFSGRKRKIRTNRGERRRNRGMRVLTNGQFVIQYLG